jgi:thiamine pyrophosphate-dependent acetolactate synthase large subunit-like protein
MALVDGGDLVARAIKQEGVDTIFTLCGGHVQAIYDSCIDEDIRIIDVRHEQVAGHAAEGWSRATRRCGVGVVTAGPGVTDCVTAIANAWHNKSPMLIIGGRSPLARFEMGALQDMDHTEMLKPITKFAKCVHQTERIPEYIAMAFRAALTGRQGPAFLEIPTDVLFRKVEEETAPMPQAYRPKGHVYPDPKVLGQAIDALRKAERPMIMGGSAIYWAEAHEDLKQFAENLNAPVFLNAMGRGSLSQEDPLFFNRSRRTALTKADAVVVIGTPMDFRLAYGKRINAEATVIQVDTDPEELGRNRDVQIPIESDARAFLRAINAELSNGQMDHTPWLDELREQEDKTRAQMEEWMASDREPIHPLRLCADVATFVDENTIVVGDGGDIVSHASKILPVNLPGQWYDPGPFGTLGVGTGFCMAINSVYPDKRIIMVNGDGAFGLNGFDFDTFVRFNIPVVSVVGNDRQWGQIAVGQKAMYGKERTVASMLGDNCRYDKIVEGMGGHGEFVEKPEDIRPAMQRALDSGKPACVNVIMDQEPPGIMGGYEFM